MKWSRPMCSCPDQPYIPPSSGSLLSPPTLKWQLHTVRWRVSAKINRWAGLNWLSVCSLFTMPRVFAPGQLHNYHSGPLFTSFTHHHHHCSSPSLPQLSEWHLCSCNCSRKNFDSFLSLPPHIPSISMLILWKLSLRHTQHLTTASTSDLIQTTIMFSWTIAKAFCFLIPLLPHLPPASYSPDNS